MHAYCCGVAFHCLKQALHLYVAITEEHSIVSVTDVRYMGVLALKGLTKNPIDDVVEKSRRGFTSLLKAREDLKG